MQKLRSSILGKKGENLDDLEQMTGEFLNRTKCFLLLFILSDFCHTGDIESLNSLLLKYANKTFFYRYKSAHDNDAIKSIFLLISRHIQSPTNT